MYSLNSIQNALVKVIHVIAQDFVQLADFASAIRVFNVKVDPIAVASISQQPSEQIVVHLVIPGVVVLSEGLVLQSSFRRYDTSEAQRQIVEKQRYDVDIKVELSGRDLAPFHLERRRQPVSDLRLANCR